MLTQEDFQIIRNMIAEAVRGPDRTGSGLSRKSLKDAIRTDANRNPRHLDTHYFVDDETFAVDDLVMLDPYQDTTVPAPLIFGSSFIVCDRGSVECFAGVTIIGKDIPTLFVEVYLNDVSTFSTTVAMIGGTPLIVPVTGVNYNPGDRIAVSLTNTGQIEVTEVILEATLLRKERFAGA